MLEAPPSTGAAKWALCLVVCLALPAAAAAAAMHTGSGIDSFVARRPPPALGSGVSLGDPLVAPPFVLASVVTFLLAAVGPGRAFRFTAVVVWCLEAGVGNGMRVPEHALPMTCAALALVLLAVFAARRAARWVRSGDAMMPRRSSARDKACRFSIGGRWVSLPASARVVDLKTALLKAAVGDAKPPDGAEEVTAAKSWVLASNGKALKDSKTLLVIPPGASITLEVRQTPKRVSDGAKETCLVTKSGQPRRLLPSPLPPHFVFSCGLTGHLVVAGEVAGADARRRGRCFQAQANEWWWPAGGGQCRGAGQGDPGAPRDGQEGRGPGNGGGSSSGEGREHRAEQGLGRWRGCWGWRAGGGQCSRIRPECSGSCRRRS